MVVEEVAAAAVATVLMAGAAAVAGGRVGARAGDSSGSRSRTSSEQMRCEDTISQSCKQAHLVLEFDCCYHYCY